MYPVVLDLRCPELSSPRFSRRGSNISWVETFPEKPGFYILTFKPNRMDFTHAE
jgi:hypothetical protein